MLYIESLLTSMIIAVRGDDDGEVISDRCENRKDSISNRNAPTLKRSDLSFRRRNPERYLAQ